MFRLGLTHTEILFCVASALLGLSVGWVWQAHAHTCGTPRDEGGGYLYYFQEATRESDAGVVVLDEEDPHYTALESSIAAALPDVKGRPEGPTYTIYINSEDIYLTVEQ